MGGDLAYPEGMEATLSLLEPTNNQKLHTTESRIDPKGERPSITPQQVTFSDPFQEQLKTTGLA